MSTDGPTGSGSSDGGQWSPAAQQVGNPGYLGSAAGSGDVGVVGQAGDGIGVYADTGSGIAVYGDTNSGIGVVGMSGGGGAGVVGLGGAGALIDGGITPVSFPGEETVGVYGSVQGDGRFDPSQTNVSCGVWGDAGRSSTGVLGTGEGSYGVEGTSKTGTGVQGTTGGDGQSGTSGIDTSGGGGHGIYGRSAKGAGVHGASIGGDGGVFSSTSGAGVSASSDNGLGGVFESRHAAQLRLVPSATPLENTNLMNTGQVGDLYLYSVAQEVGTSAASGTESYETILWLCIAPQGSNQGDQATWAQVQLGDQAGS